MKRLTTLLVLGLLGVANMWGGTMCAQATGSVAEQYLFAAANAERTQRGLPTLRWDAALNSAAKNHAIQMAARASISHQYSGEPELAVRVRQAGARFSVIAENVAEAPTAVEIHEAWMESPGHRANLLDAEVDSVGISVLRRNGELYAVEDFDRSVAKLSFDEQEQAVGALLRDFAAIDVLPSSDDARRTCEMETRYSGEREPGFVMRYTAGDLTRLPGTLRARLASGRFHQALVGACAPRDTKSFSTFSIAVLLYP